jgi:predicted anti-sigma-YlaC factor YlaD
VDCSEAATLLSALLDAELAAGPTAELSGHLEGCPECRRRMEALATARDLFRRLAPEASRLPAAAILSRAGAAAQAAAARRRRARRWIPLAAALALAAALGLWWKVSGGGRSDGSPGVAAVPAASAPVAGPGPAGQPAAGLDCGPGGEDCRRLACYSAADCGADARPVWPPIDL